MKCRPLIDGVLDTLLCLGSFVVPKCPDLVVFGADQGRGFKGNPKYVYLHGLDDQRVRCLWIAKSYEVQTQLQRKGCPVVYHRTWRGFVSLLRARCIVMDFTPKDVFYLGESNLGRFCFAQLTHGTPFKKGGQYALDEGRGRGSSATLFGGLMRRIKQRLVFGVLERYRMVLATSEETKKTSAYLFQSKNVQVLGMPRNDVLFGRRPPFSDYRHLVASFAQVYLYAPTFRDGFENATPFSTRGLHDLNELLKSKNAILLVKKHPLDRGLAVESLSHILVTEEADDIQELLVVADVLITDYSSVAFDWMLSSKPIIFYPYDFEHYVECCRGFIYDYFDELPGPFVRNERALLQAIDQSADEFSDDYRRKYEAFRERFHAHVDDQSSERVLNYIVSTLCSRSSRAFPGSSSGETALV